MVQMTVRIEGGKATQDMLRRVSKVMTDMKSGFDSTAEYLLKVFTVDVFESEGAVYGRRWTPLNPEYAAWKSTRYPGRGILERSGNMRRGFKSVTTRDYLLIKNGVPYLQKHQKGEGVPQRIIVDLTQQMKLRVEDILRDDVMSRVRRAV